MQALFLVFLPMFDLAIPPTVLDPATLGALGQRSPLGQVGFPNKAIGAHFDLDTSHVLAEMVQYVAHEFFSHFFLSILMRLVQTIELDEPIPPLGIGLLLQLGPTVIVKVVETLLHVRNRGPTLFS